MAELYPYPRFSIAERDRRWKAVRELMRGKISTSSSRRKTAAIPPTIRPTPVI